MKNSLRLGAAVAAAALVGVSDNSEADPAGFRDFMNGTGEWSDEAIMTGLDGYPRCPVSKAEQKLLISELGVLISEKRDLQAELDATRAQVEELLMRLNTMEQACGGDAAKDDKFIFCNGASCLF